MPKESIVFNHVKKSFDGTVVIPDLSFKVNANDFVTILGSSGSGKTTTLKMMNGLVEPDSGQIIVADKALSDWDPIQLRRQMGYVVQQIGLFPHMTVARNIAIVPELLAWDKEEIRERVKTLMDTVQLPYEDYGSRYPDQLSGGQQQRVGVARALAANPPFLLLDEPFGALDAITRKNLQAEIKDLHADLADKTFIFVTHDMNEAFRLGNKVIIMNAGKIEQYDTAKNIVKHPQSSYVEKLLHTVYTENAFWNELI